jgi:hypothetical protein
MAGYIGSKASVVSSGAERKKVFDITTTTTSLTGLSYTPNQVHVFHNGVRLVDGTDYTATNGTSITLTTAAENGDQVVVISYATFQPADAYTKAAADDRFVNVTGDTMTGPLVMDTAYQNGLRILRDYNVQIGPAAQAIQFGAKLGSTPVYPIELLGVVDTDGTAFGVEIRQDTNLHFNIDAAGRVRMPYQPAFLAYGSKAKSAGNWQVVSDGFTTTKYNVGNHYNTSNGRFTAPINGTYCFYAGGYSPNSGNGARYAWSATINNGPQDFIGGGDYLTVDSPLAGYLVFHALTAGDFVQLTMYSEISATIGNATHTSFFGGYLIG